ncbi:MAG: hypothetical protein AB201_01310 [Parcubacteria bacterium C7867-006]|nr:MAG: hypothetical protein AB201_01310 [Parcubacteria bacterium C7867-006]
MNFFKGKKQSILYLVLSLLVLGISYYVNINMRDRLLTIALSKSVFWLAIPIMFFSLFSFFIRYSTFKSWSKFTLFYIVISILIVLISPNSTHGMDIYPATKENMTIVLASIYSVVSIILIIYKSFKKESSI